MLYQKKIFLICVLIISTLQVNAQYSGIDIYVGAGIPLYGEKSFPEKNFDSPNTQACPPLTRPGYFTEGSSSFLLGSTTGYSFGNFTLKAGLSYLFYQINIWADPDSAAKYALPICPDPALNSSSQYHTLNLPIGVGYQMKKLDLSFLYGFPIFAHSRSHAQRLSGAEIPVNYLNSFFYRRNGGNHFFQFNGSYNFTELFGLGLTYLYNSERKLNHLNLVLKIKIAS